MWLDFFIALLLLIFAEKLMHKNGVIFTGASRLEINTISCFFPSPCLVPALSVRQKKLDVSIYSMRGVTQF
jgi:hypothetical protein